FTQCRNCFSLLSLDVFDFLRFVGDNYLWTPVPKLLNHPPSSFVVYHSYLDTRAFWPVLQRTLSVIQASSEQHQPVGEIGKLFKLPLPFRHYRFGGYDDGSLNPLGFPPMS